MKNTLHLKPIDEQVIVITGATSGHGLCTARGAVQQHIYQEEDSWLPDLVENTPDHKKIVLNRRFAQEFKRYRRTANAA